MSDVPLREHIDELLAVKFTELDRRLGHLNELRREVLQDRSQFVTQDKTDLLFADVTRRLDSLERWRSRISGGAIVAGFVFLVLNAVVALLIKIL